MDGSAIDWEAAANRWPDQEGGEVQVLAGSGFSDIPSALDQSAQPRDQLVASARTWGKELADVGVNMNLAPVADLVDIARPASNEPIGRWGREYGHDAATVSSQAGAFAEGMQASKVIPTYKHFPGLGRVKDNTDTSAGVVDSTTTRSADTAVSVIFGAAIAAGAPVIMVSSATYSLIDPSAPAVFSSTIVTDMLRREMGFYGVVITDDVSAAVQVQDVSAGDRAVRAIRAGCDLVLASAVPTVALGGPDGGGGHGQGPHRHWPVRSGLRGAGGRVGHAGAEPEEEPAVLTRAEMRIGPP